MRKNVLFLLCSFMSLYCTAQETKVAQQTSIVSDKSMVLVPLRGIKSNGVKGCANYNVSGRLASSLGLKSFTLEEQVDFKYNEKQNTLQVKYLISNLVGKVKVGGTQVWGPYGGGYVHPGQPAACGVHGFNCQPPPNRIGKTKYEIKTEGGKYFLVVTFLGDLRVEKGFFGE